MVVVFSMEAHMNVHYHFDKYPETEGLTFEGQCLHAKKIGFIHPISGEYLEFDSELPEYFAKQLESLS